MRAIAWMVRLSSVLLAVGLVALAGCGDDDGGGAIALEVVEDAPPAAEAGVPIAVSVRAADSGGGGRAGVDVVFTVERGGGSVGSGQREITVTTGGDGIAEVDWTIGIVPVVNELSATTGDASASLVSRAVLDEPLDPEEFGDIPQFLREAGYTAEGDDGEVFLATTEDGAFVGDRLVLGLAAGTTAVDGALIEMDPSGNAALADLAGDALVGPLGVALDRDGDLWVVDPRATAAGALLRVSQQGEVETVLTAVDGTDLDSPNYVAIGHDDKVYFSDPCAGIVVRYDPASETVDAVLTTDVATQGGANGLAFDASGSWLYLATESIALLCGRPDLPLVDPVAGLFRVGVDEEGFGELEPLVERRGLFGDGLAFDVEGNLYVIFDTESDFMLEESAVWVLPAGESELVKFLASGSRVFANLAWGTEAFGETTLYVPLLAVDAFGLPVRGVDRIDVGIAGLPLLP